MKTISKIKPTINPNEFVITVQPWDVEKLLELDLYKQVSVEIREIKSKRSIAQNNLMWKLINEVNIAINGWKANKQSQMDLYCQLIKMANIECEYLAVLPKAIPTLEKVFRVVNKLDRVINTGKAELVTVECYKGTSSFDTSEMNRFIDNLLDYAQKVGVDTSEYE